MTDSNRLSLTVVKETTLGTTPTTPRMRKMRVTGESLSYQPQSVTSDELRSDRMTADPILVGIQNQGGINFELSYPPPNSPLSIFLESLFFSTWKQTPERDNDGTADSVITDLAATGGVITCITGAAFVVGHLIRNSGFTNSGNNGLFRITTGSATVPAVGNSLLTNETAPPAAARVKVVGFQGASGDITATASGLGSTSLDFTTLGLAIGQWIKVTGEGGAFQFANDACTGWMRITGIAATALTCDNLPSGWTTDAGGSKTIRVYFGDQLKNGVTKSGATIERGFLGQTVPTYIAQTGMVAGQLDLTIASKQKITGSLSFMGMSGSQSTTSLDASPDAAPDVATYRVMAGSANVGRIAEAGAALSGPNWVRSLRLSVQNNLRMIEAVDSIAAVDIGAGSQDVTAQVEAYFGSNTLLAKVLAMTATNVNARVELDSRAIVLGLPRLTPMSGSPNAGGRNQDVMISLAMQASYDSVTGAHMILDRLEYYA